MPQVALLGQVNSVRGCQANVGLTGASSNGPEETRATVGKFLGVCANKSLLIGLITDVSLQQVFKFTHDGKLIFALGEPRVGTPTDQPGGGIQRFLELDLGPLLAVLV